MMAVLTEMGFGREKALRALSRTGWIGVEAAVMWLLSNHDPVGVRKTVGKANYTYFKFRQTMFWLKYQFPVK